MNRTTIRQGLMLLLACTVGCISLSFAQGKQLFKVLDYETGKPLASVQISFDGKTATTNAKGMATLLFPDKQYGHYIDYDYLKLPDYVNLGPNWKSLRKQDLLNKDTLVYYMMRADRFYAERERLFDSLIIYDYLNDWLNYADTIRNEVEKKPESASGYANEFISVNLYDIAKYYNTIANELNPYDMCYIDKEIRGECEKALLCGDAKQCLKTALSQIAANDNSEKNLQRILYYLTVRDAMQDTTPASGYYKILLDNGFKDNGSLFIDYLNCLNEEKQFAEVERLKQYAKDSCQDPWLRLIAARFFRTDSDVTTEELIGDCLEEIKLVQDSFPKFKSALSRFRGRAAYHYFNAKDTLHALLQLDSALENFFQIDKNIFYSELSYKKSLFLDLADLMVLPKDNDSLFPIMKKMKDTHVRLASEIYQENPTLRTRIFYFSALKNTLTNYDSTSYARIRTMEALLPELKKDLPEIMLPQQLSIKDMLFEGSLFLHAHPDSIARYFNDYKEALAPCEERYPYMYAYALSANFAGKMKCYFTENDFFVKHIDPYTHELLEKKARLLHKDSIVLKGEYFNQEAEYLYGAELYTQSLNSYDKAIGYYQKALLSNDSAHLDILTALLQKGDAYMKMEQLSDAFACYQQVLDYEKRIPAHLKLPYTINKGVAYHFQGDLFTMQENYKTAMKYYDKSEKAFKIVQKSGDTTFYGRWGEMHFNKALAYSYSGQEKKAVDELLRAEQLYDRYPLREVSQKYESMKNILIEFHSQNNNLRGYVVSLYNYLPYCDSMKYTDSKHYHEYINTAALLGDISNKLGWSADAVRFYKMVKEGKDFLEGYGEPKDQTYLNLIFRIGKNYHRLDSLEQAIDYLDQSKKLNEKLLSKTDPGNCNIYDLNIKSELAECYEEMEDSTNSNYWLGEALTLRKEIVAKLSQMDTNDALRRNLAYYHRKLGILYINMDRNYMAADQFDTTIAIMLPMYRNGNKEETETDLAWSYLSLAYLENAAEDEDEAAVKSNLLKCMEICENAADRDNVLNAYYNAVSMMLEILENPLSIRNEAEIKKYRKLKSGLEKELSQK